MENTIRMAQLGKTLLRVALVSLGLLMVPAVASRLVEGWNWPAAAFVRVYFLFFATGLVYALVARRMRARSYKMAVGLALVTAFALGWSTMVRNGGLGTSGAPVVSQRARGGDRWGRAFAAEGASFGRHIICHGSDACADCPVAAFGRAARLRVENRHRAWRLRGVVYRFRSVVPAREFGGIEVRPSGCSSRHIACAGKTRYAVPCSYRYEKRMDGMAFNSAWLGTGRDPRPRTRQRLGRGADRPADELRISGA